MEKHWTFTRRFLYLIATVLLLSIVTFAVEPTGTTYYVSSSLGDDTNAGTSESTPWKTLAKVSSIEFMPGDTILLKSGDIWNEELVLSGNGAIDAQSNTVTPITISSYGDGNRPIICPGGIDKTCLTINGLVGWEIRNLELCNAYQGILLSYHDIYYRSGLPRKLDRYIEANSP